MHQPGRDHLRGKVLSSWFRHVYSCRGNLIPHTQPHNDSFTATPRYGSLSKRDVGILDSPGNRNAQFARPETLRKCPGRGSVCILQMSSFLFTNIIGNRFLDSHPNVASVSYVGLPDHPSHQLALQILRPGCYGGVITFCLKGRVQHAINFIENLRLATQLANVGAYHATFAVLPQS